MNAVAYLRCWSMDAIYPMRCGWVRPLGMVEDVEPFKLRPIIFEEMKLGLGLLLASYLSSFSSLREAVASCSVDDFDVISQQSFSQE